MQVRRSASDYAAREADQALEPDDLGHVRQPVSDQDLSDLALAMIARPRYGKWRIHVVVVSDMLVAHLRETRDQPSCRRTQNAAPLVVVKLSGVLDLT